MTVHAADTHVRDHYYDVDTDGTSYTRITCARSDGGTHDWLVLKGGEFPSVEHVWGRGDWPYDHVLGSTCCEISDDQFAELEEADNLFDHMDVWY